MSLRFEEPPPRTWRQGRVDHRAAAAALRKRPGEWAMVGTYASANAACGAAHRIKTGTYRAYVPTGTFEATTRTVDGEARLYVRYMGQRP
ncbi:hypothetical protein [Streptomyces sp. NPDC059009]|uniref:hypothetical protein n=1 Tax=Streptomyces sp. NPDC059009 TaxID=3346694 RepID=UPI003699893D